MCVPQGGTVIKYKRRKPFYLYVADAKQWLMNLVFGEPISKRAFFFVKYLHGEREEWMITKDGSHCLSCVKDDAGYKHGDIVTIMYWRGHAWGVFNGKRAFLNYCPERINAMPWETAFVDNPL